MKANIAYCGLDEGEVFLWGDGSAAFKAGFLIYDHMDADEATEVFFKDSDMTAPAGVGYCLAVRKG